MTSAPPHTAEQPPELPQIARHAATVLAGQLAVMAFGVTDTLVAGRDGEASLAALSVGSAIFISIYVGLMGVLQALMPVWAQQRGAGDLPAVGRSVRQSLYLCAAASVLGMGLLLSPAPLLRWTEIPPTLRAEVVQYLAALAFALPAALLFRIYSTLNQALGRPQLVTWLQVGSLFIKIPLSIWFTLGGAGLPAQGVVGCAWATLIVNYTMLGLALWLLRTQSIYEPLQLWRPLERPHGPTLGSFLQLGVPAGMAIMVEVTSFTLMALFIARQGTTAAAAHQIASNMGALLYMVPLSLAIATSTRVSYWLGAGDPQHARRIVHMGFRLAALTGIALAAMLFIANYAIASLYSGSPAVVAVASGLLLWVAAYHLADACQTLCVFVLRSYHITVAPLVVYCVLLWGLGLGGGYLLAYGTWSPWAQMAHSPTAFWACSALALAITAAAFGAMLLKAAARTALPLPSA